MDNALKATLTLAHNIVESASVNAAAAGVSTVDLGPFLNGTADGRRQVAKAIREACEGTGFFYLTGHGIARHSVAAIFAASRRFFALPLSERMKVRLAIGPNRG